MTRTFGQIGRAIVRPQFKLARDLGLLWVGQIGTKGVAFLAFAILSRRLPPQDYGAVEYAMGLATLASLAIDGGMGSVGVRRLTQGHQSADELVALIPALQLCLALVIAPAMVLFTWFYANDANALGLTGLIALSLFILPWKQDWLFQANGLIKHVVAAQSLRVLTFMAVCFVLVHDDANVLIVGVAEIASVLCATCYLMIVQHRGVARLRLRFAPHKLFDLMSEGAPIGLGAICWAMFQYAPLLILAAMAGMADTAYFGAAHRLGISLVTFSWLYHFNLYPVISRRLQTDPLALARLTRTSIRATAWIGMGIALALTLAAEPLLRTLFGPGFGKAAVPFSFLVWTFPLTLISGHARWMLIAGKHGKDMLVSQICGVLVAIPMAWLLIGPAGYGAAGAAIAMSMACLVVWLASQIYVRRHGYEVPVVPALPAIIVAALIALCAPYSPFGSWATMAMGLTVFAILALAFDRNVVAELYSFGYSGQPADTNQPIKCSALDGARFREP